MKILWPIIIESMIRCGSYAVIIILYFVFQYTSNPIVHGIISGIFVGDSSTWIFRGYMSLPEESLKYILNILVAVGIGIILYKFVGLGFPTKGEEMVVCFVAAIPVVIIKMVFLAAKDVAGK